MRSLYCILLAGWLVLCLPALGQKQDWLPITPQEWETKEVPGNPGAAAIQLYYADYINDDLQSRFFYHRIKILTEKGNKYADVEILIPPDTSISDLKARTIHPDGTVIEFTAKPFQKVVIKGRGVKFLAKTFTMPDVAIGSIIEYKYVLNLPGDAIFDSDWTIQHDLYTVKEVLRMNPYAGPLAGFTGAFQVSMLFSNLPNHLNPVSKGGGWELEAENIAPFEAEGYMPPEDEYKPRVRFFYSDDRISDPKQYWRELGKYWYQESKRYIGDHGDIKRAAAAAIGMETDSEKKLRKLYARAQQIRNLSFERERTEEEEKKENLKDNENVADVLRHNYGWHNQITLFFVALARASGFNASVLAVSNRKERVFDLSLLSRAQLQSEIAMIKLNGKDVYLDPGTRFCPFGLLRWLNTSSSALKLEKKGGSFIVIPPATQDKAVIRRTATVSLAADGSLKGEIAVQFKDGEALEHRLEALQTDEAGKKKILEDELKSWLPPGTLATLIDANGWEGSDGPLTANFNVETANYGSVAGKRLLVPSYLFQAKQMDAFKHAERKYPVYFPYAFAEIDNVSIKVPEGYSVESLPQQQEASVPYAKYQNVSQFDGKQLVTQRGLLFNAIYFDLTMYPDVKSFFNKVQSGDEQQAVLHEGAISAQTGH